MLYLCIGKKDLEYYVPKRKKSSYRDFTRLPIPQNFHGQTPDLTLQYFLEPHYPPIYVSEKHKNRRSTL